MIKIAVESTDVIRRDGKTKNGKDFPREQTVYAYTFDKSGKAKPHPEAAKITLWDNDQPLAVGTYTLAPGSVYIDRYGALALAPKLVAVAPTGRGGA